jgi:hypothetical protein
VESQAQAQQPRVAGLWHNRSSRRRYKLELDELDVRRNEKNAVSRGAGMQGEFLPHCSGSRNPFILHQDLVAPPNPGDTFKMEQRCLLYISVRGALRRPWRSATRCVPAAAQLAAAPHARGVPHLKTQGQYRLVPG